MHTTPPSLLERLRRPGEPDAWQRFVDLYTPLIYYWARRTGLQSSDACDLVQDVLTVLVQKMPEFEYDPRKSFRAWLRTITLNKWREKYRRRPLPLADGGDRVLAGLPSPDDSDAFWESEYRRHLVDRVMNFMQGEFQETTWRAFCDYVGAGKAPAEVARELGISVHAVYLAKSRVLRRLREELVGLWE